VFENILKKSENQSAPINFGGKISSNPAPAEAAPASRDRVERERESSPAPIPAASTSSPVRSSFSAIAPANEATIIAADTEFKGNLAFNGELHINGRYEGSIESENGTLIIGDQAIVKAQIHAQDIIIKGKVQGNIAATGRVELRGKAQIFGDVRASRLFIEDGVLFVGRSENINSAPQPEADFSQIFSRLSEKQSR
jgi:cytoskeletal protein CcmA (bactofilin family)